MLDLTIEVERSPGSAAPPESWRWRIHGLNPLGIPLTGLGEHDSAADACRQAVEAIELWEANGLRCEVTRLIMETTIEIAPRKAR